MKSAQLKKVVNFVHQHNPEYSGKQLRAILQSNPEQFIDLLNASLSKTQSVPTYIQTFIDQIIKEEPIMNIEKNPSITMRLVSFVKSVWGKATEFFATKVSKVKLTSTAAILAAIAFFATNNTALLAMFAALKSQGAIKSIKAFGNRIVNVFKGMKDFAVGKAQAVFGYAQLSGLFIVEQAVSLKNFVVAKVKAAWNWIASLFSNEQEEDNVIYQAA